MRIFVSRFACGDVTTVRHSSGSVPSAHNVDSPDIVAIHRYEQDIAGHTYVIEVLPIGDARWRAQIARRPGVPTALMPFYGPTPEEAVQELSRWLTLVYNGSTKQ